MTTRGFNPAILGIVMRDLGCTHEPRILVETNIDELCDTLVVIHERNRYEFHIEFDARVTMPLIIHMAETILEQGSHYWSKRYPHEVIEAFSV